MDAASRIPGSSERLHSYNHSMTGCPVADPRRFAENLTDPFVRAAQAALQQRPAADRELIARYVQALDATADDVIAASLRHAPSPQCYRFMLQALDRAILDGDSAVGVRSYALPLVIVTGGRPGVTIPGVLPEPERLVGLLRRAGVLGQTENFAFSSALADERGLAAIPPSRLRALATGRAPDWADLDLPPHDIITSRTQEEVHLRFLVCAGVIPLGAPTLTETAAAIDLWGLAFTRELSEQLSAGEVSLLPIPRPPLSFILAPGAGFVAREELALQAFVSRELRQFRTEVGEAEARIAPLASGALGLRFASPFIEERVPVHRRDLHPQEEMDQVLAGMLELLRECGLENVEVEAAVVADEDFGRPWRRH